jgi:UDP-glucose 4-epimerase
LVIHLAGATAVPISLQVPYEYYRINTEGAARVFRVASDYGKKVIHASTGEVYTCNSPYAASKVGAEAAMDAEIVSKDADIVSLRFLNPYGVGQPLSYVIPLFVRKAFKGEEFKIHGDGTQAKDYVYVTDLVKAIWTARKLPSGSKVDVGSGETASINDIVKTIEKLFHPQKLNYSHTGNVVRKGEVKSLDGDIKPLLELGWKPEVDLYEGIKKVKESLEGGEYL